MTVMNHGLISQMSSPNQDEVVVETERDSQFVSWEEEVGHALRAGSEQVPNSQTVDYDEQLPLTPLTFEADRSTPYESEGRGAYVNGPRITGPVLVLPS